MHDRAYILFKKSDKAFEQAKILAILLRTKNFTCMADWPRGQALPYVYVHSTTKEEIQQYIKLFSMSHLIQDILMGNSEANNDS